MPVSEDLCCIKTRNKKYQFKDDCFSLDFFCTLPMYINNIQQKYNNVNYNNSKHVGKILDNSQSEIIPYSLNAGFSCCFFYI